MSLTFIYIQLVPRKEFGSDDCDTILYTHYLSTSLNKSADPNSYQGMAWMAWSSRLKPPSNARIIGWSFVQKV